MAVIYNVLGLGRYIRFSRHLRAIPSSSVPSLRGDVHSTSTPTMCATALPLATLNQSSLLSQAVFTANSAEDHGSSDRSHTPDQEGDLTPPEEQEPWVDGKPTRAIASKLLDMPDYMAESHALYARVFPSGLFRSRRHFKRCVKILRAMNRVDMVCHGHLADTASTTPTSEAAVISTRSKRHQNAKLQFSIALTDKGTRVYSSLRRKTGDVAREGTDPLHDKPSASSSPSPPIVDSKPPGTTSSSGLADAL